MNGLERGEYREYFPRCGRGVGKLQGIVQDPEISNCGD